MSSKHRAESCRAAWWRSRYAKVLLSLGLAAGVGATGTWAYWSDTATVISGSFTSGKLDLMLDDSAATSGQGGEITKSTLTLSNMVPGDSIAATVKVANNNGVSLTYKVGAKLVTSTFPAVTSPAVGLEIDTWVGATSAASNSTNATTGIRTGVCTGSAQTAVRLLTTTAQDVLLAARTLTTSANENVCVVVRLNAGAGNTFQDKTGKLSLEFSAAQLGVAP